MRRRILPLLLLLLLALPRTAAHAEERVPAAMILYAPQTGTVLQALHPDEQMLIASTTKIMTALVVLEHCALHETVEVTAAQTQIEGSSAQLQPGETYTVEELLYGLMLASGNDAACVLAEHTAGSIEGFAALMNEKAEALGLANTHFANPHGLNDPAHYSSARDLALMTAAAMENPFFCKVFAARSYTAHGVEYKNHNKLLDSCEGCIGGKTGYTRAAGRTLVSCAERDELRLICVTLNDPDDWEDHCSCYDSAYAAYEYLQFPDDAWRSVPVISGTVTDVPLVCETSGALVHRGARIETSVELPRFVFAPIEVGAQLGRVTVFENGKQVCCAQILAAASAARDEDEGLMPWPRFWKNWARRCSGEFRGIDYYV